MKKLIEDAVACRKAKHFITPKFSGDKDLMLGKLFLVGSELSEAGEAVRNNDFKSFKEELADVFIRLFDIVGTSEIDIEKEIIKKIKINWSRPPKHGKVTNI